MPERSEGQAALIGAMAGGIAHDLNTIITTIYGHSESALEKLNPSEEAALSVRRIIDAADRAKMLAAQLLDISYTAAQKKITVRVADIIADTLDFIIPSLPDNIEIKRRLNVPDATVIAVPLQLFRVFLNLTINAVQAIGENRGMVTVTMDTVDSPVGFLENSKKSLRIRFSDTGKGMDKETVRELFSRSRSHKSRGGRGFGLMIVSDAVRELGGAVEVTSAVDGGTRFDLFFPEALADLPH